MAAEPENAESKYELREVIGKGAFGEVNLVVEKQTKQKYVLKRIKMARQSEWQRRATRQEIEIVSRLRHPFIMPYKEHWLHHGHTINVVYGYCEKGDLTSAITKQRGKLFPEDTLRLWLAELLLAVDYMHRQNVLHRDIKTQNILLTGDGDVQIGDFGLSTVRVPSSEAGQNGGSVDDSSSFGRFDSVPSILFDTADALVLGSDAAGGATPDPSTRGAGQVHSSPAMHIQTHGHNPGQEAYTNGLAHAVHANGHHVGAAAGEQQQKDKEKEHAHTPVHDPKAGTRNDYALVGTPHFMSPELLSSQKYSYETDIWSLGVVMYELTTLKPPFNAFNLAGLVAKIKRAALPPIPSNYSADWTSILKSMLRKDPARRATPMDILAQPSMRSALQLAVQRALIISPDFPVPEVPLPTIAEDGSTTPGFCFAVTGGLGAGTQRTPTVGGAEVTPVLVNPAGAHAVITTLDDDLCGGSLLDTESSPLPKFPDLAATSSPLPTVPMITAVNETRASAPNLAAAAADPRRSKTPAPTRRVGATTAPGTAAAPAATKCVASPLRTRAGTQPGAAAAGTGTGVGAGRSKTPGRPLFGAAKPEETAAAGHTPSSRLVRKPGVPTRTTAGGTVAASPRDGTTGGGIAAESSQGRVPMASPRVRGGVASGPMPRVPTLGSIRSANSSRRGGLLDTAPAITVTTPRDTDSEVTTPDAKQQSSADRNVRPDSTPSTGGGQKSSPLLPGPVSRTSARTVKSTSVNTARTTRAALAAAAAAATTSPNSAAAKRVEAPTSGATRRAVTGDAVAAAAAPGTRRIVAAVASAAADGAAASKPRAIASPMRPTSTAGAAGTATATAASRVRRSQAGAPGAALLSKEAPEPATGTSGTRPRVRRLSYMSHGTKPGAQDAQAPARRTGTGIASGPVTQVPVLSASASVRSEEGAFSSQPLSASDAAADSFPASASGSSPDMLTNSGMAAVPVLGAADGKAPPGGRQAGLAEVDSLSPRSQAGCDAGAGASSPRVFSQGGTVPGTGSAIGTPNGMGDPWRPNGRSRSLVSVTTEDSELSLPDGRYTTASEMSNGGLCGEDTGLGLGTASASPSPLGAAPGAAPAQWNSNQLFSGSYNSLTGTLSDTSAAAAAAATAAGVPVPVPNGVDPAAAATLVADLPRRVSVSVFAPHLATAADGEAAAAGSEDSTPVSSPALLASKHVSAKVVPLTDGTAAAGDGSRPATEGGASGAFLSPRGLDPASVLPSPSQAGSSAATTPRSPSAPSPRPSSTRTTATSPAAGSVPSRRAPGSDSPVRQYRRAGAAGGVAAASNVATFQQQPSQRRPASRVASARVGGVAQPTEVGPHSAAASVPKRSRTVPASGTTASGTTGRSAAAAAAAAANAAALQVGAPLRTVAEDSAEEVEAQAAAERTKAAPPSAATASSLLDQLKDSCKGLQAASSAAAAGGSHLSEGERQQLALLQRVVSLASSLWEAGRDQELGMVLSSTLSRPLERRATKEAHPGPAAPSSGGAAAAVDTQEGSFTAEHSDKNEAVPVREAESGDAVRVTAGPLRGCEAMVRYRGPCHWGTGVVLGLELAPTAPGAGSASADAEEPGTKDGVTYFRCQSAGNKAAFVFPNQVALLGSATTHT